MNKTSSLQHIKQSAPGFLFALATLALTLALTVQLASAGNNCWTTVPLAGGRVFSLAADPLTPATLYAVTDQDLFKSIDGGTNWRPILPPDLRVGSPTGNPNISIDLNSPSTLFVASPFGAMLQSQDGGDNWNSLTVPFSTSLVLDPNATGTILAAARSLYRSTDGGTSWTRSDFGLLDGWVGLLAFDQDSPATVYAATSNLSGSIKKSADGGITWDFTGILIPFPECPPCPPYFSCFCIIYSLPSYSIRSMVIAQTRPSTIYVGTSAGILVSNNGGKTWREANSGLPDRDIQALAVNPANPGVVFAATPQGVYMTGDFGVSWHALNDGLASLDIHMLAAAATPAPTIYAADLLGGLYSFTYVYPNGDIDDSGGKPDIGDVLKALRIAVGLEPQADHHLLRGDVAPLVNGRPAPNGTIGIDDVLLIMRNVVGLVAW